MNSVKLPPVVEAFKDGVIYHGTVRAFYSEFDEHHRWRDVVVWSRDDNDDQRWLDSVRKDNIGPPICWVLIQFS